MRKQQKILPFDTHALTRRRGNLPSKWFIRGEDVEHTQTICLECLSSYLALVAYLTLHGSSNYNMTETPTLRCKACCIGETYVAGENQT